MKPVKMNHTLFKGINIKDMRNRTTGIVKVAKRTLCKFRGDGPARWHTIYKGHEAFAENAKIPFNTRGHHWATRHLCMDCFEDWQRQCNVLDRIDKKAIDVKAPLSGLPLVIDRNKAEILEISEILKRTRFTKAPKGQNRKANMKKNATVKLTSGFLQGVEDAKDAEFTVKAITKDKKYVILVKKGALVGGSESNPIPISEVQIVMDEVFYEQDSTKTELAKWLNNSQKDIRGLRDRIAKNNETHFSKLQVFEKSLAAETKKVAELQDLLDTKTNECEQRKIQNQVFTIDLKVAYGQIETLKEQLDLLQDKVFDKISC